VYIDNLIKYKIPTKDFLEMCSDWARGEKLTEPPPLRKKLSDVVAEQVAGARPS
jgi:hypothetical protein